MYTCIYWCRAIERLGQGAGKLHHSSLEPGYLSSPLIFWLCLALVSLIITVVLLRYLHHVIVVSIARVVNITVP
jgi:hypothetical protein